MMEVGKDSNEINFHGGKTTNIYIYIYVQVRQLNLGRRLNWAKLFCDRRRDFQPEEKLVVVDQSALELP